MINRYLIASDIHGDIVEASFIIDKFNSGNYDKLILLGDILYHGPRNDLPLNYNPKKVIALLNEYSDKIICVKGNCEAFVDGMVLKFKILEEYFIDIDNKTYYLCHGHKLAFNNSDLWPNGAIIYGHYHIPVVKRVEDIDYINVGSITLPKENNPKTYATLDKEGIKILTKEEKVFLEYKSSI